MRGTIRALTATAASLLVGAGPERLQLRAAEGSSMELFVEKTGLLRGRKHHFIFERFEGTVDLERNAPAGSRVSLSIDAHSIICIDTWVSQQDLKKIQRVAYEEMLVAGKYPSIAFRSGNIRRTGTDRYDVNGELTIRGITKPAVVAVELQPDNRFKGSATVKMTDFGMTPPSAAIGLIGTKDEMTFVFMLRATAPQKDSD